MNETEAIEIFTGPIPTLRTPYTRDGDIDFNALRRMIDFDIDAGAKVVVLTAGDSHYDAMSDAQIECITKFVIEHVAGRVAVVTADRNFDTKQAVAFARRCRELGSDIHMVRPPDWGGSCSPVTLAEHYAAVAGEMPVMIVTNIFISRGHDFGMETVSRALDASDRILAIKDDMCGLFAQELAARFSDRCAIWAGGRKQNHINMATFGAHGYLSTFLTFKPDVAHRYWDAWREGRVADAAEVISSIDIPFFSLICGMRGGFDAGLHGVLELFGLAERWRPKPYVSLDDAEMEQLKVGLAAIGV